MNIPIKVRVVTIWYEVLFKIRVSFDRLVSRKKVFYDYSHNIETYHDVVVEFIEVRICVFFDFCLDEEFIKNWWADLMFESPRAINFSRVSTVQWWSHLIIQDHSGRLLSLWLIILGWQGFQNVNMIHQLYDGWCRNWFEVFCEIHHFLVRILPVWFHLLFFGFNCVFHDD